MRDRISNLLLITALLGVISASVVFSIPFLFAFEVQQEQTALATTDQFPVTVDPRSKTIVEDAQVNALLSNATSPFQAAVGNTGTLFGSLFDWVATTIAAMPWYQSLAAVNVPHFVTITPGMRKEQVALVFAKELAWTPKQKRDFITTTASSSLQLTEGSFSPGIYAIAGDTTPAAAQTLIQERFMKEILSHYGTTTAEKVPLADALIIASLIQRETIGTSDMRLVSGVIWNRLFLNMNLQLDATLQYAKANGKTATSWWPKVVPADMYRRSAYNTYLHAGLPPAPIANPSVAAVLAALNPLHTSCLFYFNDAAGHIHCTDTYTAHVALLKKYYGRGK